MKKELENLIFGHVTLNEVEDQYHQGRISYPIYRGYLALWEWSAPRYSDRAGWKQDCFYDKYGSRKYLARMKKVGSVFS